MNLVKGDTSNGIDVLTRIIFEKILEKRLQLSDFVNCSGCYSPNVPLHISYMKDGVLREGSYTGLQLLLWIIYRMKLSKAKRKVLLNDSLMWWSKD